MHSSLQNGILFPKLFVLTLNGQFGIKFALTNSEAIKTKSENLM